MTHKTTKIFTVIALVALIGVQMALASISGAIYTSKANGTTVNQNTYDNKEDVYLNGGPQNTNGSGLPNDIYYFQVTNPSGSQLLSDDDAKCRKVQVVGGVIAGFYDDSGCHHPNGSLNIANGSLPVQLVPFDSTNNNGGEYKVWLIVASTATADGKVLTFDHNTVKTDNFKVNPPAPPVPIIRTEVDVTRYTVDANRDGDVLDAGDVDSGVIVPGGAIAVFWDGSVYKVADTLVSLVTVHPGWSITVQDRAIIQGANHKPNGTITFSFFNNDTCSGTGTALNSTSVWNSLGNGSWASDLSTSFTFSGPGAWAFKASYSGTDFPMDGGCEAWPIPSITTLIKQGNTTVTSVTIPTATVYDTAKVLTNSSENIPVGSSVEFRLFATNDVALKNGCVGPSVLVPTLSFVGVGSIADPGLATSDTYTVDKRYVSYQAIFHSGDENLVPSVADNTCEILTVNGTALSVSKSVSASLTRTYTWAIDKSVSPKTLLSSLGTFNYSVKVDQVSVVDSSIVMSGSITVTNPNYWPVTGISITDSIDNSGVCSVTNGSNVTIAAGGNAVFSYSCSYSGSPSKLSGSNTAHAVYTDASVNGGSQSDTTGTASYSFVVTAVNQTINVKDVFVTYLSTVPPGATTTVPLGTLTGADPGNPLTTHTYTYQKTITADVATCKKIDNTASIIETGQSDSESVTLCNTKTGALTIGYWQNKNGQGIITGQAKTGTCPSVAWLSQYNPFKDLSSTATCSQVGTYVTGVIKAANASGSSMNAMLKAQMLATALDVYFSDPALGGNKIHAPVPIGSVNIDVTKIPETPTSLVTENALPAFGGVTNVQNVLALLGWSNTYSNVGGTTWYGNVKPTQELAKDTFDAINNEVLPLP